MLFFTITTTFNYCKVKRPAPVIQCITLSALKRGLKTNPYFFMKNSIRIRVLLVVSNFFVIMVRIYWSPITKVQVRSHSGCHRK